MRGLDSRACSQVGNRPRHPQDAVLHGAGGKRQRIDRALEQVRAIIDDNDDDRLLCTRGHKVGTTIKETRCATVAQRRHLRDGARAFIEKPGACQMGDGSDYCGSAVIESP